MEDAAEAVGTTAEGGLLARTLTKRAAARASSPGHFDETACLNCGTALNGPHCHVCGQAAHLHRTLGALGHDLAHGVLHLDGKVWRTLPLLATKPGELTRRYVHGERARFLSPMALFLFSIFLMFAVFQAIGISAPTDSRFDDGFRAAFADSREETEQGLRTLRENLAALPADDKRRTLIERQIAETEEELASIASAQAATGQASEKMASGDDLTGVGLIDDGIIGKWRKNPGLMVYKLQTNSYKFSWLLIPLSLPFMWLLFAWKRGVRVYDHAIFVTYSLAFMSLLFVAASLLGAWGVSTAILLPLVTFLPAWHIYRQLRGAYGLSRFSALWRLAALTVMIVIVIVLFLQILLVLGAF